MASPYTAEDRRIAQLIHGIMCRIAQSDITPSGPVVLRLRPADVPSDALRAALERGLFADLAADVQLAHFPEAEPGWRYVELTKPGVQLYLAYSDAVAAGHEDALSDEYNPADYVKNATH